MALPVVSEEGSCVHVSTTLQGTLVHENGEQPITILHEIDIPKEIAEVVKSAVLFSGLRNG